jgi:hypothetical protein
MYDNTQQKVSKSYYDIVIKNWQALFPTVHQLHVDFPSTDHAELCYLLHFTSIYFHHLLLKLHTFSGLGAGKCEFCSTG